MIDFKVYREDYPTFNGHKFTIRLATPVKYYETTAHHLATFRKVDEPSDYSLTAYVELKVVDATVVIMLPDELLLSSSGNDVAHYLSLKYYNELSKNYPEDVSKMLGDALFSFLSGKFDFNAPAGNLMTPYERKAKSLVKMIPGMRGETVACPQDRCSSNYGIMDAVMHLNDRHKWKREDIADWLDTLDADLRLQPSNTAPVTYEGPFAKPHNVGKEKE